MLYSHIFLFFNITFLLTLIYYISNTVSPCSFSFSPQKRTGPLGISAKHGLINTVRLDPNLHIRAGWGNPVRGKGFQKQAKESETAQLPLLGLPKTTKLHICNMCRRPRSDLDCLFSLCEPLWALVSLFCGSCSCGDFDHSGFYKPSSALSRNSWALPNACLTAKSYGGISQLRFSLFR